MQKLKLMDAITRKFLAINAEHNDVDEIFTWFSRNMQAADLEDKQQAYDSLHQLSNFLDQYRKKYNLEFSEIDDLVESLRDYSLQEEYKAMPSMVDTKTVNIFSMLIKKSGVHILENRNLNYKQSKYLASQLYKNSNNELVSFITVDNYQGKGKIISKKHEGKLSFTLVKEVESRGEDKVRFLFFPDDELDLRHYKILREITQNYYVYTFIDFADKQEYILLMPEELSLMEYSVKATKFYLADDKQIGESARLTTKLPILIGYKADSRVIRFQDHTSFFEFCKKKEFAEHCVQYVFTMPVNKEYLVFEQPEWFMRFVCTVLFSASNGCNPSYPVHFLMVAREGTGKTTTEECINVKYKEANDIVSAESCTLKFFVPSYARSPPDPGVLAKANRICIIDEFLRAVFTNTQVEGRNEALAKMNSLLEHRKRTMGSGARESIGQVRMTARCFAVTNPVNNTASMESLCENIDKSAISRWLVYYQSEDHIDFVQSNTPRKVKYWLDPDDFLSIVDYLTNFEATYDEKALEEIYMQFDSILSSNIRTVYRARYRHHIACLLDGIIKLRCLLESDQSFKAKEEDYNELRELWSRIIRSWIGTHETIKVLDKDSRLKQIPSDANEIWSIIVQNRGRIQQTVLKEKVTHVMNGNRYNTLLQLLIDWELVTQDGSDIVAYYLSQREEGIGQTVLKETIYQKCAFCGLPESVTFSRTGKPMCELCLENPSLKKHWPVQEGVSNE